MDSYIFYKKYMKDLRGDQTLYYYGNIPQFSPSLKHQFGEAGSVWADVGTIIPWNIYLNYGDKNLLNKYYPMMKDYVQTLVNKDIEEGNKGLILKSGSYGDWLSLDGKNLLSSQGGTNIGFINSVYYYHSIDLISLAAKELKKTIDYNYYNNLKNKIYKAIIDEFFLENGKLNLTTQTSYVLCLYYKIYKNKNIIIKDFKERIKKDFYHIKTGFTGTPLILKTLFDNGMNDYAYRLLFNEDFPSWIYAVNLGATTIWERWNSILPNGTINPKSMNSFNHYSYGSVCESIYSRIAGLRNIAPGWKKVIIKPHINYRLKKIDFSYDSISGKYEIYWEFLKNKFYLKVKIPCGCKAEIILPNNKKYNVEYGNHHFECQLKKAVYSPFSIDSPLLDIIKNDKANKIIQKIIPKIHSLLIKEKNIYENNSIIDLNLLSDINYSSNIIKKCDEELSRINP